MKNLKIVGIYRDGGTIDYVDEENNFYHKYQSMYSIEEKEGGVIYLGKLTDKINPPQKAKGKFRIEIKESRVITQE